MTFFIGLASAFENRITEWLHTKTRFDAEADVNSDMAYFFSIISFFKVLKTPSPKGNGELKWWIMVCRTILPPSCTTRSRPSPKMANQQSVISLICKARLLIWYSVMETHSRRMPCTSVAVSKYDCYGILCYTFHLGFISVTLEIIHVPEKNL